MDQSDWEREMKEAQRRAEEARRAWRQAREEMRQAFRRAREEREWAKSRSKAYGEGLDESLEDMVDATREFAREVADEARFLADDVVKGAKQEWQSRWRDEWRRSFSKEGQYHWVFGGRRFRQWSTGGEEVNPFVAAILSRGAGLLSVYVLHLLAEQPRHGNDIMRQIEQRTGGSWTSNPGAVYPLLSFMEAQGLVRSQWEDPDKRTRRIYEITDQGRQELDRLRLVLRPKVMEAIEVLHTLYDELYENVGPSGPAEAPGAAQDTSGPATPPDGPGNNEGTTRSSFLENTPWRSVLNRLFGRGHPGIATLSTSSLK